MTDTTCAARMPRRANYVVCSKQQKAAAQTMSVWTRREQAETVPQTKTTAMDGSVDKLSRVLRFAKLVSASGTDADCATRLQRWMRK